MAFLGDQGMSALLLPVLIFVAEMAVVTCGTLRIIFVSRGRKSLAPLLGFLEVTIWLFAISQIMQNLSNVWCFLAFATGFTAGSFLGIYIEEKLAIGNLVIRIVTNKEAGSLVRTLRAAEYGVTSIPAEGASGPVQVIFSVVPRKELANVVQIIQGFDPRAFYSVDDLHTASQGIFPAVKLRSSRIVANPLRFLGLVRRSSVGLRS